MPQFVLVAVPQVGGDFNLVPVVADATKLEEERIVIAGMEWWKGIKHMILSHPVSMWLILFHVFHSSLNYEPSSLQPYSATSLPKSIKYEHHHCEHLHSFSCSVIVPPCISSVMRELQSSFTRLRLEHWYSGLSHLHPETVSLMSLRPWDPQSTLIASCVSQMQNNLPLWSSLASLVL